VLAPTSDVAAPTKMPSQYPIVGGFFQPNDANGVINAAYETANRAQQASKTFNEIVAKGNKEEAQAFARKYANDLLIEDIAGAFRREMGELAAVERAIRADTRMSADEKADKIKQIRAIRIEMSKNLNKISERE
jgi:dihydroxyacetone kinase